MLFFRSEERARDWCRARGSAPNPVVTMPQLWHLAVTWYGSRLTPESRRPAADEMARIFAAIGLAGDFWNPFAAPSG